MRTLGVDLAAAAKKTAAAVIEWDQGAARLPLPVRAAMRLTAKVMTTTSYRI